jgi:hypothetical protein
MSENISVVFHKMQRAGLQIHTNSLHKDPDPANSKVFDPARDPELECHVLRKIFLIVMML